MMTLIPVMKPRITLLLATSALALTSAEEAPEPFLTETFSQGAEGWKPTDDTAWKITKVGDGNAVFELTKKRSDYKPPHRSPLNIALRKHYQFSNFQLTAKVKTTHKPYGHRDLCFFFGYQDPSHFYYVHLGQKMDAHANQIFIVNDAPRTKISTKTTKGTPWKDDTWHHVKIVRNAVTGQIQVFFDDMEKPVMEATDKTFSKGQIGIGSFDDTGMWDDIIIRTGDGKRPVDTDQDGKISDAEHQRYLRDKVR